MDTKTANIRSGRDEVRRRLEKSLHKDVIKDKAMDMAKDAAKSVIDELLGGLLGAVEEVSGLIVLGENELSPNPWFIGNGLDDNPSVYTYQYLSKLERRNKRFEKSAQVVSKLAAKVVQVDVVGTAKYANAAATAQHHLYYLGHISKKLKKQTHENSLGTLTGWIDVLIRMKMIQRNLSAVSFVGAATPCDFVGMGAELAVKCGKTAAEMTQTNICRVVGADLHWRAYQEQFLTQNFADQHLELQKMMKKASKGNPEEVQKLLEKHRQGLRRGKISRTKKGTEGPACKMLYELFARRGGAELLGKTRLGKWMLGRTEVDKIIADPCGWEGVTFKLLAL